MMGRAPGWGAELLDRAEPAAGSVAGSVAVASVEDKSITQYLFASIGDLAAWVLGGLVLLWLMRLLVLLVELSPLSSRAKQYALRFAPVVELVIAMAYVTSALYELLAEEPGFAWTLIALLLGLVIFSWSSLYDLALGVTFRAAQVCQEGDLVQVDDIEGRVLDVGPRALVLQTRDGDEAVVPYGRVGRRTLRRTQSVSGAYIHSFLLDQPPERDFVELKRQVIEVAMRCHWASAVHEAKVERRAGGTVEVSVFAHDADHAPLVEQAVRRAVSDDDDGLTQGYGASPPPTRAVVPARPPREPTGGQGAGAGAGQGVGQSADQGAGPGASQGVPSTEMDEDPSDVMDLKTVLGPRLPPPPPPTWKK